MHSERLATTLGAVCDLTRGATPTMKARPGPYPLVVTAENRASSDEYQFDTEAVCVPMVSSTGHGHASLKRVHYQAGKFAVANIITACTAKPGAPINMRYLWLLLDHFRDELIVALMQGTANVSLSQRALATVPLDLPPLPDQRRIVDLVSAIDDVLAGAGRQRAAAAHVREQLREHLIPGEEILKVGAVLHGVSRPVAVDPERTYKEIGIRSHGKGTFEKTPVLGRELGTKKVFWMLPGALAFNIVFAWEGAVALLGEAVVDKVASHRFPNYKSPFEAGERFMTEYFRTKAGIELLTSCSPGGAGRNRTLNRRALLASEIHVVEPIEWPAVVELLDDAAASERAADDLVDSLASLRSSILTTLLTGAHGIPDSYDELMGVAS